MRIFPAKIICLENLLKYSILAKLDQILPVTRCSWEDCESARRERL